MNPRMPASGVLQLVRNRVYELRLHAVAVAQLRVLLLEIAQRDLEALGHLVECPRQVADLSRSALVETHGKVST